MPTFCPNCHACDCSYSPPDEYDREVIIRCNICGMEWAEPNPQYIEAEKQRIEDEYYESFR